MAAATPLLLHRWTAAANLSGPGTAAAGTFQMHAALWGYDKGSEGPYVGGRFASFVLSLNGVLDMVSAQIRQVCTLAV